MFLGQSEKNIRSIFESAREHAPSVVFLDEGRRTLLDISESAVKVTRKFDPSGTPAAGSPNQKRQ